MRLIDTKTLQLVEFEVPKEPYAILSHRWETDEVSFQDFQVPERRENKAGFRKIELACKQALDDGIGLVWIDTCCIDKASSAELSEAINSMFNWYRKALVCYAYLSDAEDLGPSFSESKWFTRGWTLQELIAPAKVVFYSKSWTKLGEKDSLASALSAITRIDSSILRGETPIQQVSVATRMSWAARRETTRPEDIAYCLMGLFDINMPMLYGEGSKAFIRLQEEILKDSEDQSLFAWTASEESAKQAPYRGLFASSPAEFADSFDVEFFPRLSGSQTPMAPTNRGIPFTSVVLGARGYSAGVYRRIRVGLNCNRNGNRNEILEIELIGRGGDQYLRANPDKVFGSKLLGIVTTVYVPKYAATDKIEPVPNAERQYSFYFAVPPAIRVVKVYLYSDLTEFFNDGKILFIGEWVRDKAIFELQCPSDWTDGTVLLYLWADHVERTQSYQPLFDVEFLAKKQKQIDRSVIHREKPRELFKERTISFGKGKQSLTVRIVPVVAWGFDMFSIEVRARLGVELENIAKVIKWS